MYHYTYKIHYSTEKFYIGVRSSHCMPEEDTEYVGSSKNTPNHLLIRKEILGVFSSRNDALKNEMKHHLFNDVVKNDLYYNRAMQNGTGFDCTDRKQSPEHIAKKANAIRGHKVSAETRKRIGNANRGKKHKPRSDAHKAKMSKALKGRPSPHKGKKVSAENRVSAYDNLAYPEEREWYSKKTGEEFIGNTQELAIILGVKTTMINRVINGSVKSYHGWYLKELKAD